MADPKIEINNPKRLSKEDFDSLRGTSLYETLFRNRCNVVVKNGMNDARDVARKEVADWLGANCSNFYYISHDSAWVYFEDGAEALHFKMRFHDHEIEVPSPPPPKPAPAAAKVKPKATASPAPSFDEWRKILDGVNGDYNRPRPSRRYLRDYEASISDDISDALIAAINRNTP